MSIHPIRFGDEGTAATRALAERFSTLVDPALAEQLRTMESIDRRHGGNGPLPFDDAAALADSAIEAAAREDQDELVLGIGIWAVRHELPIGPIDRVVNALARRSNAARTAPELSAVFGLMQGFIAH